MENKNSESMQEIERAQALMSARGWIVDPWQVKKGDRIGICPVPGVLGAEKLGLELVFGDVANVTTGTVEKRANVYVGEGEDRRVLAFCARADRELIEDDHAIDWRCVRSHLRADEVRAVPERKRRKAKREAVADDVVPVDVTKGGTPSVQLTGGADSDPQVASENQDGAIEPEPSFIPELPPGEHDPTDRGLSPLASDDGPDLDDDEESQMVFPETLPSELEALGEVDRLRAEWETKREAQERIAPIAKKYAGRLAKARKAESLAYEGLVQARATLARVRSFAAVRS